MDALIERSDGIFLYAQLVVDGMRKGRMGISDTSQFPQGLSTAFHRWFSWFFPDYEEYKRKFRLPLGMILASPDPLPKDELMRTLAWSEAEQADFICRIQVLLLQATDDFGYLTTNRSHKSLRFAHHSLMEWLCADPATQPYAVSRRDSIAAMARAFYKYFEKGPDQVDHLPLYEALHLADYLRQAGMESRASEVETSRNLMDRIFDAGEYCESGGRLNRALACYRRNLTMAEALYAERHKPDYLLDMLDPCNRSADILKLQGKWDEALALYEKGFAIYERLVREHGMAYYRRELSRSCIPMARILEARGKLDEALALYEKALFLMAQLVHERGEPEDRENLSVNYTDVARILRAQGKLDEALALCKKALVIRERLVHERGGFRAWDDLAEALYFILQLPNAPTEARLAYAQRGLEIAEELLKQRPNERYRTIAAFFQRVIDEF